MEEHKDVSRRDAMKIAISLIGDLIGPAIGIPAIAYLIGPALKKEEANWIRISSQSSIELGTPTLLKPRVTLISCHPYLVNDHRIVVSAVLQSQ